MIAQFKAEIKKYTDRIDALSLRERGLIFVATLVVLYVFAVNVLFVPLQVEQTRLENQLKAKRNQIQTVEKQVQAVLTGSTRDTDAAKREKIAALAAELVALDESLSKATTGLVTPKEMARLVEQILVKNRKLVLVKVESLAPAPLLEEGQAGAAATAAGGKPDALIYKHGMRIVLKGRYLDILNYLKALERLPWKVFWGQVSLETEKYPVSRLTLLIYTLSTREGWIAI